MIFGILSWCISSLFVMVIAYLVHRVLRTKSTAHNVMTYLFLTIFFTTLFSLLMGLVGLLKPLPLLLVSLTGLGGIALFRQTRQAMMHVARDARAFMVVCREGWTELPRWMRWLTVIALVASGIRFAFLVWALPPFVWDSLTYHLTNVAEWTQRGRITLVDTPVIRVALPANNEVFTTWFTVFLHHDVFIEAAGIPAYVLACLAVFAISRSLGIKRSAAWVASLAYGSTPALILATTGTKNDPMMAALFLMAMAIVVDLYQRREDLLEWNPAGKATLLAMALLFALGTKAYIVHLLSGLVVIGIVGAIHKKNGKVWLQLPRRIWGQLINSSSGLRWAVALGLTAALFLGGYWYIRNLILFDNPFYPLGLKIGDVVVLEASHSYFPISFECLYENLVSIAEKFGDKQYKIIPALHETTGWGWFAYGLGIPALIWALIRRSGMRVLTLGFVVSFLTLFLSTRPSPWNMRYAIWFPAVMALAFAMLYEWLPEEFKLERSTFSVLVTMCLGFNLLLTVNYNRVTINKFIHMLNMPVYQRDAAELSVYVPEAYPEALEVIPRDEVLGYNVHLNGFIYPLYRADFSQILVYVPFSGEGTCEELAEAVKDRGVKWLFTTYDMTDYKKVDLVRRCDDEGYFIILGEGIHVLNEK